MVSVIAKPDSMKKPSKASQVQTTLMSFFQKRAPKIPKPDLKSASTTEILQTVVQQLKPVSCLMKPTLSLKSPSDPVKPATSVQTKRPLSPNAPKPPKKRKAKVWSMDRAREEAEKWTPGKREFEWQILDDHPELFADENIHMQEKERKASMTNLRKKLKEQQKHSKYIGVGPMNEAKVYHKGNYITVGKFQTDEGAAWAVDSKGAELHGFNRKFNMFNQEKSPNFYGVTYNAETGVYTCNIFDHGKWVIKGGFSNPEDAAKKFDEEWVKIVGPEAALLNYPPEKPRVLTDFLFRKKHSPIPKKKPKVMTPAKRSSKQVIKLKVPVPKTIDLTKEDPVLLVEKPSAGVPIMFPTPPKKSQAAPRPILMQIPTLEIPQLQRSDELNATVPIVIERIDLTQEENSP